MELDAGTKLRLLVVDDIPAMLMLIAMHLKKLDYEVLTANTAREALDLVRQQKVHLVMTDCRMPGMDGIELMREIHRFAPDMPVIIMTAASEEGEQFLQEGAAGYLRKPMDPAMIQGLVKKTLHL